MRIKVVMICVALFSIFVAWMLTLFISGYFNPSTTSENTYVPPGPEADYIASVRNTIDPTITNEQLIANGYELCRIISPHKGNPWSLTDELISRGEWEITRTGVYGSEEDRAIKDMATQVGAAAITLCPEMEETVIDYLDVYSDQLRYRQEREDYP